MGVTNKKIESVEKKISNIYIYMYVVFFFTASQRQDAFLSETAQISVRN